VLISTTTAIDSSSSRGGSRVDMEPNHMAFLGVASGKGLLYCLDPWTGAVLGEPLDCGGEVKAAPVTDPWCGHWWLVTHGRELLVVSPGQCLEAKAR
jgi:hypothetical protein